MRRPLQTRQRDGKGETAGFDPALLSAAPPISGLFRVLEVQARIAAPIRCDQALETLVRSMGSMQARGGRESRRNITASSLWRSFNQRRNPMTGLFCGMVVFSTLNSCPPDWYWLPGDPALRPRNTIQCEYRPSFASGEMEMRVSICGSPETSLCYTSAPLCPKVTKKPD